MKRIYLVEDEEHLRKLLVTYLEKEGYDVTAFSEGLSAEQAIPNPPDLWILDIMLPGVDGYTLIKEIKSASPNVPVLFMSARNAELDRVVGLEMGSDDYLPKPFLPRELVLRANRLLQVTKKTAVSPTLKIGEYIIDLEKRCVLKDGEEISLTVKEFETINYLIEEKNTALSRSQIIDSVWGLDYFGSERVVDDTLRRLRKKLPELSIEAVYGYGYRLKVE